MKFPAGKLIALQVPIANGALAAETLPTRLKLLNWGVNKTLKGDVTVGADTLTLLDAEQKLRGFDRIGIDFEHDSVKGHPNFKPSPREYAAYGVPQVIEHDGLYLDAIQWTPAGEKFAKNYADLSPTPLLNDAGQVIFLHSVALTPQGAVEGLSFFDINESPTPKKTMNPDLLKLLATLFGTPEDATEEQIHAAGKSFMEKQALSAEKKDEPKPDEVKALNARLDGIERTSLLTLAAGEGKVIPASVRDVLPLGSLKALIAETPATVPLEKRTAAGIKPLDVTPALNASDKSVAAQLGISEADFAK